MSVLVNGIKYFTIFKKYDIQIFNKEFKIYIYITFSIIFKRRILKIGPH